MTMIRLPSELLTEIVEYVADEESETLVQDLKSLRHVAKVLADIAVVPLFRIVVLVLDEESLNHLREIANDAKL